MFKRFFKFLGLSAYEAANPSNRRGRVPGAAPSDARKELTSAARRELVRKSRYLHKNSGFAREVVSDMAIYSVGDGIKPQAQTSDPDWNRAAEEYFARWSQRADITGRFSFEQCQGLVCRGIDIDGEYFVVKVRDRFGRPRIQLLESHRIGEAANRNDTVDGIGFDRFGAPTFYRVLQDDGSHRDVRSGAVMHVFEPESASGARCAPTLQHSINHLLDEMELLALEKHAVKDNADIARVLKSESGEIDDGDFFVQTEAAAEDGSDPQIVQRIVGGKVVSIKSGESLESFESKRPSPVFTGFLEHLKRDSSAGILPYEFVLDSAKIGGAGVRLVVAKADRRFSHRKLILIQRFLKPTWGWVIGDAIDRGELPAIKGWNRVRFVTPRRITVDAGREAQQNRADVETGLKTLAEHYAEQGMDFDEQLEIRAQNARRIVDAARRHGVPIEMLYKPSGASLSELVDTAKEAPSEGG